MSATPSYWGAAALPCADEPRSIDELDIAIRAVALEMNAATYRLLMLVREFDDRGGWMKWGLRSCAEWLAWRCEISMSAAREKVRTVQALRETSVGNLTLLCSHHHRLLHEGGLAMRRDRHDENYFVRPDGRVIPRCGYRLDDMVDDFVESPEDPSAEVRETAGVYRIAPRKHAVGLERRGSYSSLR